ncbi:DUF2000 domain-containing protein [Buchananella hordeovulneris]|uniref:DUF2000 domain-containing protein n=1 Tax=Buchananella hordeovulneris TaxID=52770 RepID=A0A1Q5PYP2_9ACTO|nr:DUF2000 domain-containing protein [Buchananella hordeovulneris]MDO5080630.1 DUF2000 domain-containing protein [Buchananella hordeovulneris]OKL52572.1 hypothetical protein BSZ40_00120 [Buchananella hordeovulneris]
MDTTAAVLDAKPPVRHATRVVVLLRDALLPWQELNVTSFLISGIATSSPDMVGAPYVDADGNRYLPMLRQPVLVYAATLEQLSVARSKAQARDMAISIYTRELFSTGDDDANRAAVLAVRPEDLDLVGLALHGPKNAVDRITKGLRKHH